MTQSDTAASIVAGGVFSQEHVVMRFDEQLQVVLQDLVEKKNEIT